MKYKIGVQPTDSDAFSMATGARYEMFDDAALNTYKRLFVHTSSGAYYIYNLETTEEHITMILLQYQSFLYDEQQHGRMYLCVDGELI